MPQTANLNLYRGDDYAADIAVTESDGITPADLTGYTAQSQIRTSLQDASTVPAAEFSCSIAGNVVTIFLDHDETRNLTRAVYYWDVQIIDGAGWITTLMAGQVAVSGEITKVYSATTLLQHA